MVLRRRFFFRPATSRTVPSNSAGHPSHPIIPPPLAPLYSNRRVADSALLVLDPSATQAPPSMESPARPRRLTAPATTPPRSPPQSPPPPRLSDGRFPPPSTANAPRESSVRCPSPPATAASARPTARVARRLPAVAFRPLESGSRPLPSVPEVRDPHRPVPRAPPPATDATFPTSSRASVSSRSALVRNER